MDVYLQAIGKILTSSGFAGLTMGHMLMLLVALVML